MKTFGFSVERLACVEPEAPTTDGGRCIYLEARMTEEQMFYAVQQFHSEVSVEAWARWLERIAEEAS
jgi:hypothetical protein